MTERGFSKKLPYDMLLAAVLLAAALAFLFIYSAFAEEGNCVVVMIDGEETERYPLDEDCRVTVRTSGEHGGENLLVIENGKARVESADCPDLVCTRHSAISKNGESIVCLPHRLVIKIISNEKSDADITL